MKVKKHLKLSMNLAIPRAGVQPLGTLALILFVSSFPASAVPLEGGYYA